MPEHRDVRLARIEEGINHLNEKLERRHFEMMDVLKPALERLDRHSISLAVLKRDRRWIYGILAFLSGGVGLALKLYLHASG